VDKTRLEAFSDGVFAIAITLLVLDLRVPHTDGSLASALGHRWPAFAAYAVSFATIGVIWVNHHTLFRHFERADRILLFLNVAFLACVAFIPFPTSLVSGYGTAGTRNATTAALVYGGTMVLLALLFNALWHYGRSRLLRPDADLREVSGITRSYVVGPLLWGAATLSALISPRLSLVLYAAVVFVYVLSSSLYGRAGAAVES
jgi:TMEM175 potassium channel family protein